jgi:YVTN family beta-propeller protein
MRTFIDKEGQVKRLLNLNLGNLFSTLILLLASTLMTSAQIGGPIKTRDDANIKTGAAPAKAAAVSQRYEKEGMAVDYSIKASPDEQGKSHGLVSGADALVTFRLTDARTGQPLTGLHPSAWISSRSTERVPNEAECKDKIRTFMGGLLSTRPALDLNSYLLLTINHDNTISIINPQISFSVTKLEGIITLPGAGADWTLSKTNDFLYVTLPEQSSVAVINTITRKIVGQVDVGERMKPRRITLEPDGRYVWVGLDDSSKVIVLDTRTNKLAATIEVGAGLHNIAFTADSRFAYVTNSQANTVSVVNISKLTKVADISVGATPVPVAYSPASRLIYVAAINGGEIAAIDPARQRVVANIPVERGVVALRFAPDGRFGFVVNQVQSKVSILDASTNSIVGSVAVAKDPDQVAFTNRYAYIHSTGSEKFSLIEIGDFTKSKPSPVDIQGGRLAPSTMPAEIGVADMIAPTPEGNAAMIANNPDMMIYYYVEGMMAPMGTFTNYKRRPRALLLIDRSLSEVAPGVYSTPIKLPDKGHFDVLFLVDQPRLSNCFQLEVSESPDGPRNRGLNQVQLETMFGDKVYKAGEASSLKFKIIDTVTKQPITGLKDVRVLVLEPPGIWQQGQIAKELPGGLYEVMQTFPHAGNFYVMVGISSRGVGLADLPYTTVRARIETQRDEVKKPVAGSNQK